MSGVGRVLSRLHLVNLPQLLNVIRGDMALVGPRPVRSEFARYLTDAMPFYAHRFSVRPGILGWAQLHAPRGGGPAEECRQIEYDLFYVKEGSLWMDAEIMLESTGPRRPGTGVLASDTDRVPGADRFGGTDFSHRCRIPTVAGEAQGALFVRRSPKIPLTRPPCR